MVARTPSATGAWASAVRGNLLWTLIRDSSGVNVASSSGWGTGSETTREAPSILTTVDGCLVLGGLQIGSGSAVVTNPGGYTTLVQGAQRRGHIARKGVQALAGPTGAATFTSSSTNALRAWHVAFAPSGAEPPAEIVDVVATGQTEYMPAGYSGDIADTPAIWVNPDDASRSVILGSRKATSGGGIDVYRLDGSRASFWAAGEVNNVAVRDLKGKAGWEDRVLVIGTNRTNNTLTFGWLDRNTRELSAAGSTAVGFEPYGCCLYVSPVNGDVYAFVSESTGGAGGLKQYRLTRTGATVTGAQVRSMPTATLAEGMACDDATQTFFLTEEDAGFYKYGAEPGAGTARTTIDLVGDGRLVADVEGVTIAYGRGDDTDLVIVSSQGDNTFVAYELAAPHAFVRKWRVVGDEGLIGDTTETDGIAITRADLSPWWPDGLFVAHDTTNDDLGQPASNFKLVDAGRIFPDRSYRAPVVELAGTSTASLTSPAARWSKSPMAPLWLDTVAAEWRAIVPTPTGHRLFHLDDTHPSGGTLGPVVSADQGSRVAAVHHEGTTYVLVVPSTGGANLTLRRFNSAWAQVGADVAIPFTGNTFDRDAQPVTLFRASNGHLFIAWNQGTRTLSVRRSTDDGVTWGGANGTANLTMATVWNGISGPVALGESGSNLVLVATANDGIGSVVRTLPFAASPITTAAWGSEALPAMPAGVLSDDHLSMISLPDGRLFAVTKTTGSTDATTPLFRSLVRATAGTWTQQTLEPGPDELPPSYTRPRLTMLPSGEVLVFFGGIYGANDLLVRSTHVDALGTWSGRSTRLLGPDWSDAAVLPEPSSLAAAGAGPWPVLAHNRDEQAIAVQWPSPRSPGGVSGIFLGDLSITGVFLGGVPVTAIFLGEVQIA